MFANRTPALFAPWPTAIPANNGVSILFATHHRVNGAIVYDARTLLKGYHGKVPDVIDITFHRHNKASAANGIRAYAYDDSDSTPTWRETDMKNAAGVAQLGAVQVPALVAPAEFRITLNVGHLKGVAIEYTAGADNPEEWNGTIRVAYGVLTVTR